MFVPPPCSRVESLFAMAFTYLRRCCCCDVSWGTMTVAVWTMVCCVMSLMQCGYTLAYTDPRTTQSVVVYSFLIVLNVGSILSAALLVIGTVRMNEVMLRPYMVFETMSFVSYFALEVALVVVLINGDWKNFPLFSTETGSITSDDFKFIYVTVAALIPLFLFIKIPCLLCVLSFYRDILLSGKMSQLPVSYRQEASPLLDDVE
ncbi:uncharacterized protein LOC110979154 [Acanthaster planci]|uniref:Uncharacterized protein LOC110979154 n=1 Tax=Acanthaster planci TaxID=133434 RepID=A0A8B7YB08_ACAPL|nr:uncharacterized protein LOC110979154 [Acanthaster planci]